MPKKKAKAKVTWSKFSTKDNAIVFSIENNYYDKDMYLEDGAKQVNDDVMEAIQPSKSLIKLLVDGKIRNLKVTYEVL